MRSVEGLRDCLAKAADGDNVKKALLTYYFGTVAQYCFSLIIITTSAMCWLVAEAFALVLGLAGVLLLLWWCSYDLSLLFLRGVSIAGWRHARAFVLMEGLPLWPWCCT